MALVVIAMEGVVQDGLLRIASIHTKRDRITTDRFPLGVRCAIPELHHAIKGKQKTPTDGDKCEQQHDGTGPR